jgi:isoaspartyl peptidase/L-asparaginase-like protein (Ntn-hydrolase superfamily)
VRDEAPYHAGLRTAAAGGWAVLSGGGSALDAVQAAAVALEDDPLFNAGRGSVLNERGEVEHDAAIMCGRTGRAGGVAAVRGIRNPIVLARVVMEETPHVLLASSGALALAEREDVERVDPSWHVTKRREAQWRAAGDTVGAVAVDGAGHVAAATSTGGTLHKLQGRIGDSPLPGAGLYAADDACAVSASGHGEAIMRAVAAHEVAAAVRHGGSPLAKAVRAALGRIDGAAGLIAVGPATGPAIEFNTAVFHRAVAGAEGIRTAVAADWR